MILAIVAAMTVTFGFAETRNHHAAVRHADRIDLNFDVRRLANKLQLNTEQMEAVQEINNSFNVQLMSVDQARGFDKMIQFDKAVKDNIRSMHYVLDDNQFRTYVTLLGTTIRNQRIQR